MIKLETVEAVREREIQFNELKCSFINKIKLIKLKKVKKPFFTMCMTDYFKNRLSFLMQNLT